ncbi:zf-BED domain-containing protein [Tanacetum coccineum]|uniref:Zf-BED domain-containing protein n=1 Tax=Tanacetum coccineum TaxID=301880 RepID=A0ABQ4YRT8_9ASTR
MDSLFGFYRRFWKIIENDVYDVVKYFFTYGNIPKGCNSSFIALIPKIPDANMVKDFRPISLIGSLYKIIAKILANRLVGVLGDIVNETMEKDLEMAHRFFLLASIENIIDDKSAFPGKFTLKLAGYNKVPIKLNDSCSLEVQHPHRPLVRLRLQIVENQKGANAPGARTDAGWEHAIDLGQRKVKCKFCSCEFTGGIYRFKHHLARTHRDASACPMVPEDIKVKFHKIVEQIELAASKKQRQFSVDEEEELLETDDRPNIQILLFQKSKSALPFNCVKNPEFKKMIQMVGDFGRGLDPPSFHEMRVTYLKKEVDYTKALLEDYKKEWKKTGCTLMSDGWSDRKNRSICNFLMNNPKGEEHVVQVVTDNATNYKAAGEMLMNKREKLFWTPCAAHCIDLMLEDFEKKIKEHKGKELLRPGATRFATSYLTLGRLHEQKGALISMFASEKWTSSSFSKLEIGKNIESIVLDTSGFWGSVSTCLLAAIPLIKVLRMVDSDSTPAMGFIYHAMNKAKEEIKSNYKAGYFLNPRMQYSSDFKDDVPSLKVNLYMCIERMCGSQELADEIDCQLDMFKNKKGHLFSLITARHNIDRKTPVDWWDSFGDDELKRFAMRVLSLTCSSSGCERNLSAFEMVHSKRRNCLHQQKMNDLVYVMYNLKLSEREQKKMKEMAAAIEQLEALDFEDVESDDEWITEEESTQSQAHDGGGDNGFLERAIRSQFGRDDEFEEPDYDLHDENEVDAQLHIID